MSGIVPRRVGVILGSKDNIVKFLGYGVYEGDFDPDDPTYAPAPVGGVADMAREAKRVAKYRSTNPRIRLDNGKLVWGCECWWGDEEKVKKKIEAYKQADYIIKDVDIDEERKPYQKEP